MKQVYKIIYYHLYLMFIIMILVEINNVSNNANIIDDIIYSKLVVIIYNFNHLN